ncbi:MAG: RIP metalloprotease RseP [Bacillota bacterium]|nr:RIP metalloprotease RseP [Candidatus Fermentithermobacillaceae bacterium]
MSETIVALLTLGVLILFHELGHFIAGRKLGVYIHEFSIGFGPKLLSRDSEETEFTFRMIPLGGFVRFAGEDVWEDGEESHIPRERLLYSLTPGKRSLILFAGPLMNLLVATLAFFIVFSFVGFGRPTTEFGEVVPGFPAHESGILPGDKVVRVEDVQVVEWEDMVRVIQPRAGIPTKITVERNGEELTFTVVPVDSEGVGVIGVRSGVEFVRLGVIEGIREGFRETFYVSVVWITGVFGMIVGKVAPEVTGPLGISQILGEAARHGLGSLLYLAGAISANLALINLLPIPALDGSRLFFVGIEAVRGKPIDPEKESFVHLVGFFLLMIAFLVVTYKDILRLMQ